jgi:hypothetical protein
MFRYTEKSGVDCVQNVEKTFCSCNNIYYVGTPLFFTMFRIQSIPDFSVADFYGLRNTTCLYSKDVASGAKTCDV